MAETHFERLIKAEMEIVAKQTVDGSAVKAGDGIRHAVACGRYEAFVFALKTYREAARTDVIGDGDGM